MNLGMYTLTNDVALSLLAMNNDFYQNIANLSMNLAKQGKYLSVDYKPLSVNTGGRLLEDNGSVVNLLAIPPMYQIEGNQTLLDEIAYMRASLGDLREIPNWWEYKTQLALDYFLRTSLCLVEVFSTSDRTSSAYGVEKFLATRSPAVACVMNGDTEMEKYAEYEKYLEMQVGHYQIGKFKLLKLSEQKNKNYYKVTRPRSTTDLNGVVKVTPIALMAGFMEGIQPLLEQGFLKFSYVKDNLILRELTTTTNTTLLHQYYPPEQVQKSLLNRSYTLARGYMRVPELGISKYDETGVRALNLTRIVKIEQVDTFDDTLINVDTDKIMPALRLGIENIGNFDTLKSVYYDIVGNVPPQGVDIFTLKHTLLSLVESRYSIGTTTALKEFHKYMLTKPEVFQLYNGGVKTDIQPVWNFNMGFDE